MLLDIDKIIKKYKLKINGILHIGAHKCEELPIYNNLNINNVIWIDANPKLSAKNIHNFVCSNTDKGYSSLHITNNSDSSTIYNFDSHLEKYPDIYVKETILVPNKTIDTFYKEQNIPKDYANMLVLCIQGSELLALQGMNNTLKYYDAIITKVNYGYVYKNNTLIKEMDDFLIRKNFKRVEVKWTEKDWGQAFYIKK